MQVKHFAASSLLWLTAVAACSASPAQNTPGCTPGTTITLSCASGDGQCVCEGDGTYGNCVCPETADATDAGMADTADAGPSPTIAVVMRWSYDSFTTTPVFPQCGAYCMGATVCTMMPCSTPGHCASACDVVSQCSQTAQVYASQLPMLVADYPSCDLGQISPAFYTLSCGDEGSYMLNGTGPITDPTAPPSWALKYTDGCAWSLPYAANGG